MFDPLAFINKLLAMPPEEAEKFLKENLGILSTEVGMTQLEVQQELVRKRAEKENGKETQDVPKI